MNDEKSILEYDARLIHGGPRTLTKRGFHPIDAVVESTSFDTDLEKCSDFEPNRVYRAAWFVRSSLQPAGYILESRIIYKRTHLHILLATCLPIMKESQKHKIAQRTYSLSGQSRSHSRYSSIAFVCFFWTSALSSTNSRRIFSASSMPNGYPSTIPTILSHTSMGNR